MTILTGFLFRIALRVLRAMKAMGIENKKRIGETTWRIS
jgi:hypothetical protein